MNEETKTKNWHTIQLTAEEYSWFERAMQWPEDLPAYDMINKPTNLSEIGI